MAASTCRFWSAVAFRSGFKVQDSESAEQREKFGCQVSARGAPALEMLEMCCNLLMGRALGYRSRRSGCEVSSRVNDTQSDVNYGSYQQRNRNPSPARRV